MFLVLPRFPEEQLARFVTPPFQLWFQKPFLIAEIPHPQRGSPKFSSLKKLSLPRLTSFSSLVIIWCQEILENKMVNGNLFNIC